MPDSETIRIDSTPEWVVEQRRMSYSASGPIPLPWETITLNRKGNLWGAKPMEPRSFKACVNLYRRFFNYEKHTFEIRIRNISTGEIFLADFLL